MQHKIGVREKKDLQIGVRGPKSLGNPELVQNTLINHSDFAIPLLILKKSEILRYRLATAI